MKKTTKYFFTRWCMLGALLVGLASVSLWVVVPNPFQSVAHWASSSVLLDKQGTLIHARLSADEEWCFPIPLEAMGEWLPKVLISVEDKRFYSHGGVDTLALGRAIGQMVVSRKVVSGASTITSQLVRFSHPRPRTVQAKVIEFIGAIKLEQDLTKDEILEYYLNRAPFGGPIRGVEAAAQIYFGKHANELSLGESALLIGMLKGPTQYRPDKNPQAAKKRRQHIIKQVAEKTGFPNDLTQLALDESLPIFHATMPMNAWHFSEIAFSSLLSIEDKNQGGVIRSTLDIRIQKQVEVALQAQLRGASPDVTAAAVVIDNTSGAIVAYVGNSRFNSLTNKGWVDCAIAPRSPGSTLKPFIYLDAFEKGLINSATLLADTPSRLGGEAPRNFDSTYRGPVTVTQALADSLNVPVVRVLRMLGVKTVLHTMRSLGFSYINRKDAVYGDSLALGAGEVSLVELARAYTMLANLGGDRALQYIEQINESGENFDIKGKTFLQRTVLESYNKGHFTKKTARQKYVATKNMTKSKQLLPSGFAQPLIGQATQKKAEQKYSQGATFLIADILKDSGRLPFIMQVSQARDSSFIAFKTGTSYGLRDAWTVAYYPAYTVAVWFGKEGGGADSQLIGLRMAAPVAMGITRELQGEVSQEKMWYTSPADIESIYVCALSGAALSVHCPQRKLIQHISKKYNTVPCTMHVWREGQLVTVWPVELEDFLKKRFSKKDIGRFVQIISPLPETQYVLTSGIKTQPIALQAEGVTYPVHWYMEGEYVGEQKQAHMPLYLVPHAGEVTISLLDAEERTARTTLQSIDMSATVKEPEVPVLGK